MDIFALFSRGENLVQGSIGEKSLQADEPLHQDLVRLIAIANMLQVEIFPLTWQPSLEMLGQGATGSISQSALNDQVHFAFKRFNRINTNPALTESDFRRIQFDAMISEMVVLSCPEVCDHPNIVDLEGLCWEVVRPSGEVWPVLVFQRAKCGDLRHFLKLPEAGSFNLDDRIFTCGEVAKALRIMHQCGIIHGDIKAENILVTKGKGKDDGMIRVHVIDFGYSSFESLVKIPRSLPWEAPEWHSRYFNRETAKRMDIYSFGLLCLWLLFPADDLHSPRLPNINLDLAFSTTTEDNAIMRKFQELKASGKLLESVLELLWRKDGIPKDTRSVLEQLFRLSLHKDPAKRATQMDTFINLLCKPENLGPLDRKDVINSASLPSWHGKFKLENILFRVDECDFAVQQKIVEQLISTSKDTTCRSCSKNAAFRLALCYSCGFGCRADSAKCRTWLEKSGRSDTDLEIQLDLLKEMKVSVATLSDLFHWDFNLRWLVSTRNEES
ncbi:kinase-like protein [Acephala macrosclerotiorum]|nr:kinase-like protein [Acephala macrosclerotiorum]